MSLQTHKVFLKTNFHTNAQSEDYTTDVIPLNVTSISISTSKTIPSFPIPLSGIVTGESVTAALDLGMASKTISLNGFITDASLKKNFNDSALEFTAFEFAQILHSSVDSTAIARNQSVSELIILMPSKVDENYTQVTERDIPFTYRSRGGALAKDNHLVPFPNDFPTSNVSKGLEGFIRSFSCNIEAETTDISFSLEFEVAEVVP